MFQFFQIIDVAQWCKLMQNWSYMYTTYYSALYFNNMQAYWKLTCKHDFFLMQQHVSLTSTVQTYRFNYSMAYGFMSTRKDIWSFQQRDIKSIEVVYPILIFCTIANIWYICVYVFVTVIYLTSYPFEYRPIDQN